MLEKILIFKLKQIKFIFLIMKQKKQSKSYSAPALEKGLDILELLSNSAEGLSQVEIAGKLNKSITKIYRMITTLRNREYVD